MLTILDLASLILFCFIYLYIFHFYFLQLLVANAVCMLAVLLIVQLVLREAIIKRAGDEFSDLKLI